MRTVFLKQDGFVWRLDVECGVVKSQNYPKIYFLKMQNDSATNFQMNTGAPLHVLYPVSPGWWL